MEEKGLDQQDKKGKKYTVKQAAEVLFTTESARFVLKRVFKNELNSFSLDEWKQKLIKNKIILK